MKSIAPLAAPSALALLAAFAPACDDINRFSTSSGEAYCGSITLGSAFRAGLSPRVQMRLRLDASMLDGPSSPGVLSTFEAADGDTPERRLFDDAELRLIPPLAHDQLAMLEFGEGRERNAIYSVSPADLSAESVLAVVSLRSDNTVEIRLLRAGMAPSTEAAPVPDGRRPLFGIFTLIRRDNQCGF